MIYSTVVCWGGGSIRAGDINRLNKLIRRAGSVIGCKPDTFEVVVERRTLKKLLSIMDRPDHPLHPVLDQQWSSNRPVQLRRHKDRYRKSFLPTAVKLFKQSPLAGRELSAPSDI